MLRKIILSGNQPLIMPSFVTCLPKDQRPFILKYIFKKLINNHINIYEILIIIYMKYIYICIERERERGREKERGEEGQSRYIIYIYIYIYTYIHIYIYRLYNY